MKNVKKVLAAGHICLDITPVFPGKKRDSIRDVLVPGKLLHMNGVEVSTGGSTANTGLGFRALGADVKILAKVGDDSFGWMVRELLAARGVTDGLILDVDSSTSYSVVVAVPGIDRIFLHDAGANATYVSADVKDEDLEGAEWFHFGYPPLMERMYRENGAELVRLFQRVKEKGIPVSLDMAAVDADSEAGQVDWKSYLQNVLPYVDVFLPSLEELLFMVDREKYDALNEQAAGRELLEVIDIERDVYPLAQLLLDWGVKVVVIKCGTLGLYLKTGTKERLQELGAKMQLDCERWAEQSVFETCYRPEKICSGTGAGDTSISAFLMAMLTGETPQDSIALAAAEGASCVESYDAISGLRTLEELKEKIAGGWEKA